MFQCEAVQNDDEDNFFDLLSRFQSKRMDDQRCSLTSQTSLSNKENECENNAKKDAGVLNGKREGRLVLLFDINFDVDRIGRKQASMLSVIE